MLYEAFKLMMALFFILKSAIIFKNREKLESFRSHVNK